MRNTCFVSIRNLKRWVRVHIFITSECILQPKFSAREIFGIVEVHAAKGSKFDVPHDESVYIAGDPHK
jgi:hypothetical protein